MQKKEVTANSTFKNRILINLLSFTLITGLWSCSNERKSYEKELGLVSSDLYSDRPTNITNQVLLLRLKSPSLLERAVVTQDKKLQISEKEKEQLLSEQKVTIEKLKALSKDIKLLYTYKFSLNALAVSVPSELVEAVGTIGTISELSKETIFKRPAFKKLSNEETINLATKANKFPTTSITHIGGDLANNDLGIRGKGVKVGIIDTGIDYTHSMLGGSGDTADFENMDGTKETPLFPNKKVVGGFDFVGEKYSPGATKPDWRIPRPDINPIDEGGHGTHVAGTVAGIGDDENTYSGVAPDSDLYALKVFGKNGGTSDTVVIAAMEWAIDPNGDLDPSDRLDVLNLSLGGTFGKPYILYSLALKNLTKAGIIATISAGNSGANPYIVGAPSTTAQSISVGASIDAMPKNWQFDSIKFSSENMDDLFAEKIEATFTPPTEEKQVSGEILYVGDASEDFTEEVKENLKGKVALIDRGKVTFVEKVKRAEEAGAIGVVVVNNNGDDPISMGGEGKAEIPAVMIRLDLGFTIKELLKKQTVIVNFVTDQKIEKPQLIDTITTFSSQGPRSEDGLLKPDLVAPGFKIISAARGSGNKGIKLNGTSMSAPHMAGVMALIKEKSPQFSVDEAKAAVMNTAKPINDAKKNLYSVTRQGAGRVQVFEALNTDTLVTPPSLSLGEFQLEKTKTVLKTIVLKNLSNEEKNYTVSFEGTKNIQIESKKVIVKGNSTATVKLRIKLTATENKSLENHEGFIIISEDKQRKAGVPVLAVSKRLSDIYAKSLKVYSSNQYDSFDALTELTLKNSSTNQGILESFNLLAKDKRKPAPLGPYPETMSRSCDLQAVGYRIVKRQGVSFLQLGIKIYNPVTNWQACEVSVLIDSNLDGIPEQEIGGLSYKYLSGLDRLVPPKGFYSVLLDYPKAVSIRKAYEQLVIENNGKEEIKLTYREAIVDIRPMITYPNSHLAIVEVNPALLKLTNEGRLNFKIAVFSEGGVEFEDKLQDKWFTLSPKVNEQSYLDIPFGVKLKGDEEKAFELKKGYGSAPLMLVSPTNYQVSQERTEEGKGLMILYPDFN